MNGINLATNTMANWVIRSTDMYLSLIYDRMHELIYDSKVIHADETPVKVMRIEQMQDQKREKELICGSTGIGLSKVRILSFFMTGRIPAVHDHPREFLKTFSGTVVTDGYQVYHKLEKEREDLKVAGCWIHARRPFADFIKSVGLTAAKGPSPKRLMT